MTIVAAADGSALGNPGPAGWAWYVDDEHWAAGGWPHGTNNQGELMAVLDLFRATAHTGDDLHVLCDSQYVINTVTQWMPGWKRKGWRKRDGSPVMNLELVQAIDREIEGRDYRFEWVKGHAGHPLNEAADLRARGAATAFSRREAADGGPGWPGRREVTGTGTGTGTGTEDAPSTPPPPPAAHPELFDLLAGADDGASDGRKPHGARAEPDAEGADAAAVLAGERRLLDPAVRADADLLGSLLDRDFAGIGPSGRRLDRRSIVAAAAADLGSADPAVASGDVEVLSVERLADDVMLLEWRLGSDTVTLRSSLWVRRAGGWRLRFTQGTRES